MQARAILFAILLIFAVPARGQLATGQTVGHVFHLIFTSSAADARQLAVAIRSVDDIAQVTLSEDCTTLTVNGTPAQLALAAWLFTGLDQPEPASAETQEYRPARSGEDVIRILRLTRAQTPQTFQEIVNAVRMIPEIDKAFPVYGKGALVMRGTDAQVAMGEWVFHQLDLPGVTQTSSPAAQGAAAHEYVTAEKPTDIVRTLRAVYPHSPQGLQEIVNAMRVIPVLNKVSAVAAPAVVAFRGTPEQAALATWLFRLLDRPAEATAQAAPEPRREFRIGGADDVTCAFYFSPQTTTEFIHQTVTRLRETEKLRLVFPIISQKAVLVRGAATEIAAAALLIERAN